MGSTRWWPSATSPSTTAGAPCGACTTRRRRTRRPSWSAAPGGAIWDVAVDLRPGSPTYRAWFGAELSDGNRASLYIPQGCAHGFLSLTDASEVAYQMSAPYAPDAARGVRWDDPAFGIEWPGEVLVINQRDTSYPDVAP